MVIKVMLLFWHSHVKGGVDFSFPKSSIAVTCCDSSVLWGFLNTQALLLLWGSSVGSLCNIELYY